MPRVMESSSGGQENKLRPLDVWQVILKNGCEQTLARTPNRKRLQMYLWQATRCSEQSLCYTLANTKKKRVYACTCGKLRDAASKACALPSKTGSVKRWVGRDTHVLTSSLCKKPASDLFSRCSASDDPSSKRRLLLGSSPDTCSAQG